MRILLFLLGGMAFAQTQQDGTGTWSPFARLKDARYDACALRVAPGEILITGGTGSSGPLNSAEILHADGTVTPAASMKTARARHTCTLLADGRVLVTGGGAGAEIYDPAADAWTSIAGRNRSGATATLMPDGRVLVAGGYDTDTPLDTVEIFDPATNTLSSAIAQLREPRRGHAAALLPDGRVILIAGNNSSGLLRSTEIFDPMSGNITAGPALNFSRTLHSATALEDGRILVAGGSFRGVELNSAEILDAAAQSWSVPLSRLKVARSRHFAVLVPGNGGVVLGGGSYQGEALAITEVFQPGDDTFQFLGNLTAPRTGLAGAPLDDGVLLAMGGTNATGPQNGCGILNLTSLTFSSASYHSGQIVAASGNNLPANTTITFTLELVQGGSTTNISNRLITRTVTTSGPVSKLAIGGFGPVNIVTAQSGDVGGQFRLTAQFGSASIVRSVPVKVVTTLAIPLPVSVLEGQSATFEVDVKRILPPGPLTGTVTATFGTASVTVPVSGSGTPVPATFTRSNLPAGPLAISASYSGDLLNEPSTASATYNVVSRTPIVEISSSLDSPRVGTPFTLFARVRLDGILPSGPPMTGVITILESGVPIGPANVVTSLTTPPNILSSRNFTALSFAPLRFTASFAGDSNYQTAASTQISPVLQKAQPTLSIVPAPTIFAPAPLAGQPAVFQCGAQTTFNANLNFPPTLGLSNRSFTLTVANSDGGAVNVTFGDGSVRTIGSGASGTLVPSATQLGTALGSATVTLPFTAKSVTASFAGDTFFNAATSAPLLLTMQPLPMKIVMGSLPSTATNPLVLSATVTIDGTPTCSVSGPEGTVEFFDGTTSLGIVPLAANTIPITQITDGTSNTIQLGESGKTVRLTVSRPVGVHNLKARYSGDAVHAAAESAVVAVTFQ